METPAPKRGRGRPRKDGGASSSSAATATAGKTTSTSDAANHTTRSVTQASARSLRPRPSLASPSSTALQHPSIGLPSASKRPGRPRKQQVVAVQARVQKRGPGRPKKSTTAAALVAAKAAVPVAVKRRGRPPKASAADLVAASVTASGKRRGRPPKATTAPAATGIPYETWDVFTTTRFAGNALAVVHLPSASTLTQAQKQAIAKEFNYSETTFVLAQGNDATVDIFTPFSELPFAGHPTIGTICSLAHKNPKLKQGRLEIKAGTVPFTVARADDGTVTASAEIPHDIHRHSTGFADSAFKQLQAEAWGKSFGDDAPTSGQWPVLSITKGMTYALLEVASMDALANIQPKVVGNLQDFVTLDEDYSPSFVGSYFYFVERREDNGAKQVIHTRMIESDIGEDAVTGSAASALAAYLAMELFKTSEGREAEFEITQGEHLGRSGTPRIRVVRDEQGQIDTMELRGESKRVMHGYLDE